MFGFESGRILAGSRAAMLLISLILGLPILLPGLAHADTTNSTEPTVLAEIEQGLTPETAIPMPAYKTSMEGISAEEAYIAKTYPGWTKSLQALVSENDRYYDVITIKGPGGAKKDIYFDITDWMGAPFFPE